MRQIPSEIEAAIAAYRLDDEKVEVVCARFDVTMHRLYRWIERLEIQKRGQNNCKTKPDPKVKTAIEAYQNGCEVRKVGVDLATLYDWIDRLGVERHGRINTTRKLKPDPHVLAALRRYEQGVRATEVGIPAMTLYDWLQRMDIPRQFPKKGRFPKTGKQGHPLMKPWPIKCDWCGDPLSPSQIKRRRKYCCTQCHVEGLQDTKNASVKSCQAPNCNKKALDDTSYCSWKCFKTTMEAQFG